MYVTLQRTAEEVAGRLAAAGFPAKCYHAGMEAEERTRTLEQLASLSPEQVRPLVEDSLAHLADCPSAG